jgi:hypothetical protein
MLRLRTTHVDQALHAPLALRAVGCALLGYAVFAAGVALHMAGGDAIGGAMTAAIVAFILVGPPS